MGDEENFDEIEETTDEEAVEPQKKKLKFTPLLKTILVVVLAGFGVLFLAGIISFVVARSVAQSGAVEAGITDEMVKSDPPNFYSLGEFSENTSDLDQTRFVRVNMTVTYRENPKRLATELPERILILRDRIGTIMSTYSYDVLRTIEGKRSLKEDIKREINSQLKNGQIEEVLFDGFTLS